MSEHDASGWESLRPADAEPRHETGRSARREEVVRGLRDLAALLEDRPDIPVPVHGYMPLNVFAAGTDAQKRAQVDHAAGLLNVPVIDETADDGHYIASVSFGIVHYRFLAIPSSATLTGFAAGQDVQLTPEAARDQARSGRALAGVVVACPGDPQEPYYTIRFPGWNATVRMHASALEPAIPLGPVSTSRGTVTSIDAAETALVETAARLRTSLRSGSGDLSEDDERDLIRLSSELGRVCGLSEHELMRQLDPWITVRTAEHAMSSTSGPVHLAATDVRRGPEPVLGSADSPGRTDRGVRASAPRPGIRR